MDKQAYVNLLTTYIDNVKSEFQRLPGRVTKRKIVRAFQGVTLLKNQVNDLAQTLLGQIPEGVMKHRKEAKLETRNKRNERTIGSRPARLIFRGPINQASAIEPASWMLKLLKKIRNIGS